MLDSFFDHSFDNTLPSLLPFMPSSPSSLIRKSNTHFLLIPSYSPHSLSLNPFNMQAVTVTSFPTTEAGVTEFKTSYGAGVARFLNISSSAVNVISATATSRRERRVLLSVTVNVVYVVTLPQTTARTLSVAAATAFLTSPTLRAAFDESLVTSGLFGAASVEPQLMNLSPTSAPTQSPVKSAATSTLRRDYLLYSVVLLSTCFMLI